ncbi:Glycosyl transferases group 1 [Aliarcobacter thereius]|uniref:Glycosyl transferases group 1 n=1 Tax=Aliarcobacter thereius TaxID=544718 RepID=A0A1C0B5M6_9BACT|nr:glycosyltransferase [Aliarcobacter thereius]OCL98215.1 Glycosyl transferases group 1 [Aliarcobacter thereius]
MQNKTIHIGPIPPPIGGISIYLYRLSRKNKDLNTLFINEMSISKYKFIKILFLGKKNTIIYHSPSLYRRLLLYICTYFTTNSYIIVSHGQGLENSYKESDVFIKYLLKKTIMNSNYIQIVGNHLLEFLVDLGYSKEKIKIQHAFIEPPLEDEKHILETYPINLSEFLNKNKPIVVANASSLVFHKNLDLYGLDMCIELTAKLKQDYPNIGFVFALANERVNIEYLNKMKERIKELDIEDNFYFLTGQKELWPLFKKANLMIRPTSSDGYGISIAEALYFDCPAIASDVSDRPEGTILFKSRDLEDLYIKSIKILGEK